MQTFATITAAIGLLCLLGTAVADDSATKSVNSAKILIKNKDYEGAKRMLKAAFGEDAKHAEAIYLVAVSDENIGNIKEAIDGYNACLEVMTNDPSQDDPSLKKQCRSAIDRLDEGRKIVITHARQMEQEAATLKDRNESAYATVMAAIDLLAGEELDSKASATVRLRKRPNDAVQFEGHWYKFFSAKFTWHTAKAKCEEMGGRLACAESQEEAEFLTKLCREEAWIGGSDEQDEGNWKWVDGSPMRFTYWAKENPSNSRGGENALEIWPKAGGRWNDNSSDARRAFICEWDK